MLASDRVEIYLNKPSYSLLLNNWSRRDYHANNCRLIAARWHLTTRRPSRGRGFVQNCAPKVAWIFQQIKVVFQWKKKQMFVCVSRQMWRFVFFAGDGFQLVLGQSLTNFGLTHLEFISHLLLIRSKVNIVPVQYPAEYPLSTRSSCLQLKFVLYFNINLIRPGGIKIRCLSSFRVWIGEDGNLFTRQTFVKCFKYIYRWWMVPQTILVRSIVRYHRWLFLLEFCI